MEGNFNDSNLESSDFSHSYIKTVDFHRTNLTKAIFRGALIDAAEFHEAHLEGADFDGASAYGYFFVAGELPAT
jgi:uncharacterized protein YjbI with pentapeptide repeats